MQVATRESRVTRRIWFGLMILLATLVVLGLAIACFGTLVGAGGGFILMPIMLLWHPEMAADRLTALSLTMIFFNALSGTIGYARLKRIDYKAGLIFAGAALPGAIVGAMVVDFIPRRSFDLILAGFLFFIALFLLWRGEKRIGKRAGDPESENPESRPMVIGAVISVFVGFISSVLGIGGGIIHVPALVHLVRFPVHIAAATSHFVLAITSGAAVGILASKGMLAGQYDHAAALSIGAVVGAQIGARLSGRIGGAFIVRALAIAMILAAARVAWQGWMGAGAEKTPAKQVDAPEGGGP